MRCSQLLRVGELDNVMWQAEGGLDAKIDAQQILTHAGTCLKGTAACTAMVCCVPVCICVGNTNPEIADWHPCERCILDNYEVEILHTWRCECGHVYSPDADGSGRDFRDLPGDWPCPSCGQQLARNWVRDACEYGSFGTPRTHYDFGLEDLLYTPRYMIPRTLSEMSTEYECTNRSVASVDSFCTTLSMSLLVFDTDQVKSHIGPGIPSARWHFVEEPHEDRRAAIQPLPAEQKDPDLEAVAAHLCSWCCDLCEQQLFWEEDLLWCRSCSSYVTWPVWQEGHCSELTVSCKLLADRISNCASDDAHEDQLRCQQLLEADAFEQPDLASIMTSGDIATEEAAIVPRSTARSAYACGNSGCIGREVSLTRPGLRARGGTAGPWCTITDPWFLGV